MQILKDESSTSASSSTTSSDTDTDTETSKTKRMPVKTKAAQMNNNNDEDLDDDDDDDDEDDDTPTSLKERKPKVQYIKTKGEITIDEMPEENFEYFSLDDTTPIHSIGIIHSILNNLLVVKSNTDTKPLDEGTW
jgi:hypothetical protein